MRPTTRPMRAIRPTARPTKRLLSSTLAAAVCCASGVGCLAPADLSPAGFACSQDSDCGEGGAFRCEQSVCTPSRESLPTPLRGAFFSVGYPYAWNNLPAERPSPVLGRYDSRDPAVVTDQLAALHHAQISLALVTWWGPGTQSDQTFDAILDDSAADGMRWAVAYQKEPQDHPTATEIRLMLADLYTRYAQAPNYGWVGERFVMVVPTAYNATCDAATRWVKGRDGSRTPAFLLMEVPSAMTEGAEEDCEDQPDAWYRLPNAVSLSQTADATVILPGEWPVGDATPSIARDLTRFRQDVATMAAAPGTFQLVESFNDWVNGTYVEASAAEEDPTAYLDALHDVPVASP